MFSATLPDNVVALADSVMHTAVRIAIGAHHAAALEIDQKLTFVSREEGKLLAFRQLLREGGIKPPCLVFVQSKERFVRSNPHMLTSRNSVCYARLSLTL